MIQTCAPTVHYVAELHSQDDKRQFLPGRHAEPAGLFPLQDPNVLAEQEQFQVLRMIRLKGEGDKIKQEGQK